ncbi:MAG: lipopolysaccharide biosynthesis protein [Microbacterium sp.]|nr:MAG: lipopolysaccharide biosynthesis protein [Microbacterium sp.]
MVILARLLTPAEFGLAALASTFVAILLGLAGMGFGPYIIRAREASDVLLSTAFWLVLGFALLLAGLLEAFADLLAFWLGQPDIAPLLRVLALTLPITSLSTVPSALLTRDLLMRKLALAQVFGSLIGIVAALTLAFLDLGVWALIGQSVANSAVVSLLLWRATSWRPKFAASAADISTLLRAGLPTLGTQLVQQLRDRGDELIIGAALGATPLGYWVIATRITRIVAELLTSVVSSVALPVLSRMSDDRQRFARASKYAISNLEFIVLPALTALAIVSPVLIPTVFGAQWVASGEIAQITTLATAVMSLGWLDDGIWWALGRFSVAFILTSVFAAFHLAVVAFSSQFGLVVLALAVLGRAIITAPIRAICLIGIGKLPIATYGTVPFTGLATATMAAAMLGVSTLASDASAWLYLSLQAAIAIISYVLMSLIVQRQILTGLVIEVHSLMRRKP